MKKPKAIDLLSRTEIDDDRWNSLVKSSVYFRHYALTYFLDATAPGWKALVADDYRWVWPVPVKKFPLIKVYQPLLAQQLGPFGQQPVAMHELVTGWKQLSRKFLSVSVKFADVYQDLPMPTKRHVNIELSLRDEATVLVKGYNRNVVSNIKKGEEASLRIVKSGGFDADIVTLFREGKGKNITVLDDKFYRDVAHIYQAFSNKGEAETWVANHEGKKVAGVMLLKTQNRLLNFFTASSQDGRKVGAMHSLFDTIILNHAGLDWTLDFEGSNDPDLAFFYRSFGGSERVYLQAVNSRLPF